MKHSHHFSEHAGVREKKKKTNCELSPRLQRGAKQRHHRRRCWLGKRALTIKQPWLSAARPACSRQWGGFEHSDLRVTARNLHQECLMNFFYTFGNKYGLKTTWQRAGRGRRRGTLYFLFGCVFQPQRDLIPYCPAVYNPHVNTDQITVCAVSPPHSLPS